MTTTNANSGGVRIFAPLQVAGTLTTAHAAPQRPPFGTPSRSGALRVCRNCCLVDEDARWATLDPESRSTSFRRFMELGLPYAQEVQRDERYRAMFDLVDDAVIVTGVDGRVRDANDAAVALLGHPLLGLRAHTLTDLCGVLPQPLFALVATLRDGVRFAHQVTLRPKTANRSPWTCGCDF